MKNLILPCFLLIASCCNAQTFKKYPISNSGCSIYMYCEPPRFDIDKSEDSSIVYTSECPSDGVLYGVICIKLLEAVNDLNKAEELVSECTGASTALLRR